MQTSGTIHNKVATSARHRQQLVVLRFLITLCAIATFSSLAAAQTWTSLGPRNEAGVINGLYLHTQANKLFASAYTGGLWVTDLGSGDISSPWCNSICIRAAMHPGWLRCSSL